MRHLLFLLTTTLTVVGCGGTPTPSDADRYIATYEAERDSRQSYFDCTTGINDQIALLEKDADACLNDYDCKAMIAQQMEEIANNLYLTCSPVPPDLLSDLHCKTRLIRAKASYIHGAPNETGANRVLAEEVLADQVKEAYENCFSSLPEPSP